VREQVEEDVLVDPQRHARALKIRLEQLREAATFGNVVDRVHDATAARIGNRTVRRRVDLSATLLIVAELVQGASLGRKKRTHPPDTAAHRNQHQGTNRENASREFCGALVTGSLGGRALSA
jgi:hypothetical protein